MSEFGERYNEMCRLNRKADIVYWSVVAVILFGIGGCSAKLFL